MKYQKSYRGLLIWFVVFLLGSCGLCFILSKCITDSTIVNRVILFAIFIFLDALMFIIYKTESVYWINGGPDFETAKQASSERRKTYARKHLRIFLAATGIFTIYLVISTVCHLSSWLDILAFCITLIAAAFRTIPIQF